MEARAVTCFYFCSRTLFVNMLPVVFKNAQRNSRQHQILDVVTVTHQRVRIACTSYRPEVALYIRLFTTIVMRLNLSSSNRKKNAGMTNMPYGGQISSSFLNKHSSADPEETNLPLSLSLDCI